MMRFLYIVGLVCFVILIVCALFHAGFLALAWLANQTAKTPVCQIFWAWPFPFANCPGMNWPEWLQRWMHIPGAIISLPLVAHQVFADRAAALQPFIVVGIFINFSGWLWALLAPVRWIWRPYK